MTSNDTTTSDKDTMNSVYTLSAVYQSDRFDDTTFESYIDTDNHVYADRDTAEMTADLLNELAEEDNDLVFFIGLHGNDYPVEFFVTELALS